MPQLPLGGVHGLHAPERAGLAAHALYLFTGEQTCIDCHKGIAHKLPDMKDVPIWTAQPQVSAKP